MFRCESLECPSLPLKNFHQKIYDLSPNFCIALIQVISLESESEKRLCQLHIKLIEKETERTFCLDKNLLLDLARKLSQFERVNIEYPCAMDRNSGIDVKLTQIPGEYQIIYQTRKLHFDSTAKKNLILQISDIIRKITEIEVFARDGFDEVDF